MLTNPTEAYFLGYGARTRYIDAPIRDPQLILSGDMAIDAPVLLSWANGWKEFRRTIITDYPQIGWRVEQCDADGRAYPNSGGQVVAYQYLRDSSAWAVVVALDNGETLYANPANLVW